MGVAGGVGADGIFGLGGGGRLGGAGAFGSGGVGVLGSLGMGLARTVSSKFFFSATVGPLRGGFCLRFSLAGFGGLGASRFKLGPVPGAAVGLWLGLGVVPDATGLLGRTAGEGDGDGVGAVFGLLRRGAGRGRC